MPIFLAPLFLLAGLAAGIPVMLHLLHRRNPRPVQFSTLRFLQIAVAKTRRSRHLTHVLSLLLRMLILLLLAIAFSRPKLRTAAWLPEGRRTVVIVLDASASMQCDQAGTSNFEQARQWALALANSLNPADRLGLVSTGGAPASLAAISDHEPALQALRKAEPGVARADLLATLTSLLARLPEETAASGLELHLFSDFQKTGWQNGDLKALDGELSRRGISLFFNRVTPPAPANAGIRQLKFSPPVVMEDGQLAVHVNLASTPDFTGANNIALTIAGQKVSQQALLLEAGQPQETVLRTTLAASSEAYVCGQLQIEPDAYAADNQAYFCLQRLAGVPIYIVDSDANSAGDSFFLRRAIQPAGTARTQYVPELLDWQALDALDPRSCRVVYLCNPPSMDPELSQRLQQLTQAGATVVLFPGDLDGIASSALRFCGGEQIQIRQEVRVEDSPVQLVTANSGTALEQKVSQILPDVSSTAIRRRLVFSNLPPSAKVLFRHSDGAPFWVGLPAGKGTIWLSSVAANRSWSQWPLTPHFVILQQELIGQAVQEQHMAQGVEVGDLFALPWPDDALVADFQLFDPDGRKSLLTVRRSGPEQPFLIGGFSQPGIYRLRRENSEHQIAVNIPSSETELDYLADSELTGGLEKTTAYNSRNWAEQQKVLATLQHGRPLWPWLLLLAFLLTLAEEVFSNVRSWTRPGKEATPPLANLERGVH
jgi:hypothetical protein